MRIAIVIEGSVWGGVEGYAFELRRRLELRAHEAAVFALAPRPVERALTAGARRATRRELALGLHGGASRTDQAFDVVHVVLAYETQFLTAIAVRALTRRPFVLSEQLTSDTMFFARGAATWVKKTIARRMKQYTYDHAFGVVAPSAASRATLLQTHALRTRAAIVAYNPCECPSTVLRYAPRTVSPVTRFVTVARLVPQKGVDVLVDACYLLARRGVSYELRVVGDGPELEGLMARVAAGALTERVRFLGQSSVVESHLAAADVFVLPSRYEGLPFTILEAMCAGLPIVSTRVSGIPEAVGEHAGRLVPPDDPEALADAMEWMCRHPEQHEAMGAYGRARVAEVFGWDRHLSAVERLYEQHRI